MADPETAPETEVNDDIEAAFDLSVKKKKKKPKKKKEKKESEGGEGASSSNQDEADDLVSQERDRRARELSPHIYDYELLLTRVLEMCGNRGKEKVKMKPPQLVKQGTKKTIWVNFSDNCKSMNRTPEHVFSFFMAELGTEGSIDGNQRLVIRGRYVPRYIESLLKKYIGEYATCQMCRSAKTNLSRDSTSRLHFMKCDDCGSHRSVAPIKAGFHATTRADRRAAKSK